jgi:hypothetical protein
VSGGKTLNPHLHARSCAQVAQSVQPLRESECPANLNYDSKCSLAATPRQELLRLTGWAPLCETVARTAIALCAAYQNPRFPRCGGYGAVAEREADSGAVNRRSWAAVLSGSKSVRFTCRACQAVAARLVTAGLLSRTGR